MLLLSLYQNHPIDSTLNLSLLFLQWGDGVHAAIVSVGVADFCLLQLLISSVLVGCY